MFLWPSTTPGRVSTSTSRRAARCTCAKFRICACANRMSSRSCPVSSARQASISPSLSRKSSRSQRSNLMDISRTAASPLAAMSFKASSTTRRTLSSAAAASASLMPVFRYRGIGIPAPCCTPPVSGLDALPRFEHRSARHILPAPARARLNALAVGGLGCAPLPFPRTMVRCRARGACARVARCSARASGPRHGMSGRSRVERPQPVPPCPP